MESLEEQAERGRKRIDSFFIHAFYGAILAFIATALLKGWLW